jgi:hypothetical protein
MKEQCMNFINNISSPTQALGSSYLDITHNVFYVVADVEKELSLFKIETLIKKIQIVFVFVKEALTHTFRNAFNAFLETLSPLNRMLLTQHISIVNMDPSPAVSVYKFSIGISNLQYTEGQRYYCMPKPTTNAIAISIPGELRKDGCFAKLIDPSHDLNFNEVTEEV